MFCRASPSERALLSALLLMLALAHLSSPASAYSTSPVSVWSTTPVDPSIRLAPQPALAFTTDACTAPSSASLPSVSVDAASPLQPLVGFGAALTESTAYNFLQLKARNASAYSELLERLFAPAPQGIAMSFMRVPITSCDLSLPTDGWSYDGRCTLTMRRPTSPTSNSAQTHAPLASRIPLLLCRQTLRTTSRCSTSARARRCATSCPCCRTSWRWRARTA